jgi:hypothetical protein
MMTFSPTRVNRAIVASAIAAICGGFLSVRRPALTDFSVIRFGGDALLHGANLYNLVGPGKAFDWDWPALYPATAYVLGIPFTFLPDRAASIVFVVICTFFLAYAITRKGWQLLPIFLSLPFIWSVILAQWTIILTAIIYMPVLAVVSAAKPQGALSVVLASERPSDAVVASFAGGIVLLAVSLVLLPGWPVDWLRIIRDAGHLQPPLLGLGGFLILAVLLRWREREARLILLMAAVPQMWLPYSTLPLMGVARTFRESLSLAVVMSAGALIPMYFPRDFHTPEMMRLGRFTMLATAYLPAVIIVLRRPHTRFVP